MQTTVEKGVTRMLIVGQIKEKIKWMMSTTYSWEPYSMERYKNKTGKNTPKNG